MKRQPAVSVLLTCYNREQYIASAIESVLSQWYEDFELLVVDDASTDSTVEVARRFEALDPRVRVIENAIRANQFGNRNRAATHARGTLIRYHDSDDLMYPHCLAVSVPPMLAEPRAGIGLSMSRAFSGGPAPMLLTPRQSYQREFFGMGMFTEGPSAGIFRRADFLNLGGFPDAGVASDTLFWLYACARLNVVALPGDLYWYRRHGGQELADRANKDDYHRAPGQIWRSLGEDACPLAPEEVKRAKNTVAVRLLRAAFRDARAGNPAGAFARIAKSGIPVSQLAKHARPHQHSLLAGTPLSSDGDYLVPDWSMWKPADVADPGSHPE